MLPRSDGLQLAPSNTGGVLDGRGQRGKEINSASAKEGIHLALHAPADGRGAMSAKSVKNRDQVLCVEEAERPRRDRAERESDGTRPQPPRSF